MGELSQKLLTGTDEPFVSVIELAPGIQFHTDLHCLIHQGKPHPLPGKEFELLSYFVRQRGRFVTTDQILRAVWDEYTTPETVRQYVYRLRRKLHADRSLLLHLKGIGYTLIQKNDVVVKQLAVEAQKANARRSG